MNIYDWIAAAVAIIPTPAAMFPGVTPGWAWIETARLLGFWVCTGFGLGLITLGLRK